MRLLSLLSIFVQLTFAQGVVPPLNTWTSTSAGGYPSTPVGFEKAVYVGSRQAICFQTNYLTRGVTSEIQDALFCYDYAANWGSIVEQGGGPHSLHTYNGGHSVSTVDYYAAADAYVFNSDNSYGNQAESMGAWWVWYPGAMLLRDAPIPAHSSNSWQTTRAWLSPNNQLNAGAINQATGKLFIFNDYRQGGKTGTASVCTINSLGVLTTCVPTSSVNIPPSNTNSHNIRWNSRDGLFYVWGGVLTTMTTYSDTTDTWKPLATSCSGPDCVGTHPPARQCAGFAYSSRDNVFLLMAGRDLSSGCSSSAGTSFADTWKFDPGTNAWTELCGPGMIGCAYPNSNPNGLWDKLEYDPNSNVFVAFPYGGSIWAYAISTPSGFGRTARAYTPSAGSLNRTPPGAANSTIQGNSMNVSATVGNGTLYVAHAETDQPNGTNSNCKVPTVYVGSVAANNTTTWLPGGTTVNACLSFRHGEAPAMPESHPYVADLGGVIWAVYEKHNSSGLGAAASSKTFYQRWTGATWDGGWARQSPGGSLINGSNTITLSPHPTGLKVGDQLFIQGGTGAQAQYVNITAVTGSAVTFTSKARSGAWTIEPAGFLPCFTTECRSVTTDEKVRTYPAGLAAIGSTLVAAVVEENNKELPKGHRLWLSQFNPAANTWTPLGSALNNTPGNLSFVTYASQPATDGNGNIAECWTEQINSAVGTGKITATAQPRLFCKLWNGSSWSQMGTGPLNLIPGNWAYLPSVTYHKGAWYLAFTEGTQNGNTLAYVLQYHAGANSWSVVGGIPLNINTQTGMAYHPSLATDGNLLYVAWEEQATVANRPLGRVKTWNGSAWSPLGLEIAADAAQGSVQNMTMVIVGGVPTVVFEELEWGNLRQIYRRVWNGSDWVEVL